MRDKVLIAALLAVAFAVGSVTGESVTPPADAHGKWGQPLGIRVLHQTDHARRATWACQDVLGLRRTKTAWSDKRSPSIRYRKWVRELWEKRAKQCSQWRRELGDPIAAIRAVFGAHAEAAISVASCETGGTFDVFARNGQYLGLFQMGSWERATYGHGVTPLEQARAAYRYFVASGMDWSPWECKP